MEYKINIQSFNIGGDRREITFVIARKIKNLPHYVTLVEVLARYDKLHREEEPKPGTKIKLPDSQWQIWYRPTWKIKTFLLKKVIESTKTGGIFLVK